MNIRLLSLLLLAACSPASEPPASPPLEGAAIGGPFTLTNQDGRTVSDRDFPGKYRIMYFGYTFCPDVCPVDVQTLAAGLKLFEKQEPALARRVVPIFVSVDPERDTPPVLKQFVSAFHFRMVGMTGSPEALQAVTKGYGVFYSKGKTSPGGGYLVSHSRVAYLMSPEGKPLALLPQDESPQGVADVLARWVRR